MGQAWGGVFDDVYQTDGLACAYMNDLKVNHIIIEAKKELDYLFYLMQVLNIQMRQYPSWLQDIEILLIMELMEL